MVTVKWPKPSHHPTDKVTYYWLQSRCEDASKHGGKHFPVVTAGGCTFSTMGLNCMRYLIDC